jgi:hypothetical protein
MMPTYAHVVLGLALGLGLGAVFFRALRANARLYLESPAQAIGLHVARFALATAGFLALARLAPGALVPALGAFTIAGFVASRRAAELAP